MTFKDPQSLSYADRLNTFRGYWDGNDCTARQLAAIGHVCDRPPIEAIDEGSHCISCNLFLKRHDSVKAFEGPLFSEDDSTPIMPNLHHPNCIRLQVKIPLESQIILPGSLSSFRMNDTRDLWERRLQPPTSTRTTQPQKQSSSLFSLPTEIRLEIYSMILPVMDKLTTIVPLNSSTERVITAMGYEKVGRRDMTKIHLLSTCQAVYDEASDILFSNVTYKFDSTKILYLFLRHIGAHGRGLLVSVDVFLGGREDAPALALLASCPKLRNLTLRLQRPVLMLPGAPIWIVDGVACLLELSGLESVYFGACKRANCLDDSKTDAALVRTLLTRPRNAPMGARMVNGDWYI